MFEKFKKISLLIVFILISCEKRNKEEILRDGLYEYSLKRGVGQGFIDNFIIEEIAFIEQPNQFDLVLKVNKNINKKILDTYTLGIHVYSKKINLSQRSFDVWDIKPKIENYNGNNFIIREFRQPVKEFDSIIFFLYDNDLYRGIIGNRIVIRNIKL
ncbi:MAG: hypothetical protein CVU03_09685 [Bacteroidetes bacterium HGW-Bacteroidetes-2]|jgi:hypothetical protein|nr:MAG: hypothetical protein CVU03_09685 [Bacteroidetes bacterium HGW-Bacteroidetes-2]